MNTHATFRRVFVTLACAGLFTDQASKYLMFRWLHNAGTTADAGRFKTHADVRGEYDLVPGVFKFAVEFDKQTPMPDAWYKPLQEWSAPVMPLVNHGALFGLGGQHKTLANLVFALISLFAAVAIIYWGRRPGTAEDKWLCTALGLILGGTIGNLYDRLVFGGVRDFLYFYAVEWPVFNVADCCLVVGAVVLLAQAILVPTKPDPVPAATPA